MGLKQNGRLIHQMPLRHRGIAGFEYADTNKSQNRNIFAGEAGFNPASGTPNGHRSPSSWVLPQKDGGISSYTGLRCEGTLEASGAMGKNFDSLINDNSGTLAAIGSLLASLSSSINGVGSLNSDLLALLNMAGTLTASGDIVGALSALGSVLSAINGSGSVSLVPYSTGNLASTITTVTELSPQGLASAVWGTNVENGMNTLESLKIMLSALAGQLSGAGTTTISIRDINNTIDRIVATVDANGNRSSVTLNKD